MANLDRGTLRSRLLGSSVLVGLCCVLLYDYSRILALTLDCQKQDGAFEVSLLHVCVACVPCCAVPGVLLYEFKFLLIVLNE